MILRLLWGTLWVGMLCGAVGVSGAQGAPDTASTGTSAANGVAAKPSAMLQPSLDEVQRAIGMLTVERWKASKATRDATAGNLISIRHDLDATLPGLLTAADAASETTAGTLPLLRNLSALYDVLLRVTIVAGSSAPPEQTAVLDEAMTSLEQTRRALGDRMQSAAETQDARVAQMQKQLAAAAAAPAPTATAKAPSCPAPAPAKHKKPAAKPAAPATNGSASAPAAKPQ